MLLQCLLSGLRDLNTRHLSLEKSRGKSAQALIFVPNTIMRAQKHRKQVCVESLDHEKQPTKLVARCHSASWGVETTTLQATIQHLLTSSVSSVKGEAAHFKPPNPHPTQKTEGKREKKTGEGLYSPTFKGTTMPPYTWSPPLKCYIVLGLFAN